MKKAVSIITAICLIISLATPVLARYQYIDRISANLTISSSGTATCDGLVTSISAGGNGEVTVTLERFVNGSWTYVNSWTTTGRALYTTGTHSQSVTSGFWYRVVVVGKVYNSSGTLLETADITTGARYY